MGLQIPVTFKFKGKTYHGVLGQVTGAGAAGTHYHLNIDGYFRGQFLQAEYNDNPGHPIDRTKPPRYRWLFYTQKGGFPELAAQFEKAVNAWHMKSAK